MRSIVRPFTPPGYGGGRAQRLTARSIAVYPEEVHVRLGINGRTRSDGRPIGMAHEDWPQLGWKFDQF